MSMLDLNLDPPAGPKPHPNAERCTCDCHRRGLGRAVHVMPCCNGGWKMPLGYIEGTQLGLDLTGENSKPLPPATPEG